MTKEELLDRVRIARCMYAAGKQHISDAEYDNLVRLLAEQGIILDPVYEDDPTPYDAFERVMHLNREGVDELLADKDTESSTVSKQISANDLDFLNESDSLSIVSVTAFEEALEWFRRYKGVEMIISTKIDGINTRRGYKYDNGKLYYRASLTRGRRSDPINISENMRRISPTVIPSNVIHEDVVVYSETVVPSFAIDIMNEKYATDYTIPRGLAMAMMRVERFSEEDFQYLKSYVFRVDYGKTLEEGLCLAEQLGFDVVPYVHYTYNGESFDVFKSQMEEIISNLKGKTDGMSIVTDGMVAEVNDRTLFSSGGITNNYSSANLALKIGLWVPGVYESEVRSLDFTMQADRCACVAIIDPVIAKGGQTISRVNCFNPATLFEYNILPGSRIRFEYKNETTVNLLT